MFHELVTLRHYLEDHGQSLKHMLDAIQNHNPGFFDLLKTHQVQGGVPAELTHFIEKGIAKNQADRWQSAGDMIQALQDIREGKVKIQCHATFTKRVARELGRFVDRHPHAAFFGMIATVALGSAAVAGAMMHWVM